MSEHDDGLQGVKLVDVIADHLKRYRVLGVLSKTGTGSVEGPATFQIFGRGPSNRQLILDVFLRLLVASEQFEQPIHVCRTYKLKRGHKGKPQLVHGYTIAGACKNKAEIKELLAALDLEEWFSAESAVDEALFWEVTSDGGVAPSREERNVPQSEAPAPDGARGVWPVRGPSGGRKV